MVSFPPGSPRKGTYGLVRISMAGIPVLQVSKAVAVLKGLVAAGTGRHGELLASGRRLAGSPMQTNLRREVQVGLLSLQDGRKTDYRRFGSASEPIYAHFLGVASLPCICRELVALRPFPNASGTKVVSTSESDRQSACVRADLWVPIRRAGQDGPVRGFIRIVTNDSHAVGFQPAG
jgi:hypothetical protein